VGSVSGATFTIGGSVPAGATWTVIYEVTVDKPDTGDHVLDNFVVPTGSTPPPTCTPTNPRCTHHVVGELNVTKSVDPKNFSEVHPGDILTYTLTFQQVGAASVLVNYTDSLARVLDDATVVAGPRASNSALTVSAVVGGSFRITGSLSVGQVVTVTYKVKVKEYDAQGDHKLDNFLQITGTRPPSTCEHGQPMCTENPVPAPRAAVQGESAGSTAVTGGNWGLQLSLAALLVGAGGLVSIAGIRRRRRTS
jgi:hypothetical protein